MPNLTPLETDEQYKVCQYLDLLKIKGHDILYSATAQNTYTKSWKQKRTNSKLGVHKGLPDLVIIINKVLIFIEMKRLQGSKTSLEQKLWNQKLNDAGEYSYICKGHQEAIKLINKLTGY